MSKVLTDGEVLNQALTALVHAEKDSADFQRINTDQTGKAIEALRAALEQPDTVIPTSVQPQGEQEPVAWIENVEGGIGYNPYHEAARKLPDGVRFDLYVHPQNLRCKSTQARLATLWGYVKAEPLTDEQIAAATGAKPGTPLWLVAVAFTRAIEAAHGIKDES